jgi:hypothetical protein
MRSLLEFRKHREGYPALTLNSPSTALTVSIVTATLTVVLMLAVGGDL